MKSPAGKKVLVVGMARSGRAVVDLLLRHGAEVRATDTKPVDGLPVPFGLQSDEVFENCDWIVLSPGVPSDLEPLRKAREKGVRVIGEVELASGFLRGKTIGITGSNGKTTTTALVGHILRECGIPVQVGGNIGTPVTAMIDPSRDGQWNVLELSSFQLETVSDFHAEIGVALNVTPDHLDRHGTLERYAAAKGRLFETQRSGDFAVLNADDATCVGYAACTKASPLWFSLTRPVTPGVWLRDGRIWFDDDEVIPAAAVPIRGRHNLENVMAAAAAARLAGANLEQIARAIRGFAGVEHRLEFVRRLNGVDFYNDSKATNVDATQKALDAFDGGLFVILGGKDKGSDYTVLADSLRRKARGVLLIGAAAPTIRGQIGNRVELTDCGTLEAAVAEAVRRAQPGNTVLLAPACASFDQFENYEHRGRVFKSVVASLREVA